MGLFDVFKSGSVTKQPGTIIEEEALKKISVLLARPGEPPTLIYKYGDGYISTIDLSCVDGKNPLAIYGAVLAMGDPDPNYVWNGMILAGTAHVDKNLPQTFGQLIKEIKNGSLKIVVHNPTDGDRIIKVY
jgi:hypothetical protein